MTRDDVVEAWVYTGIMDFYIAFFMSNKKFYWYDTFYYHQGLEKTCKAYLLGARSAEYDALPEEEANAKVGESAKKLGHNLHDMIKKLIEARTLDDAILKEKLCDLDNKTIDGNGIISLLEKVYMESRYPVPDPAYTRYPVLEAYYDPFSSCPLDDFACHIGLEIIRALERDFRIVISREKPSLRAIDVEDWTRFRRIFFKEVI